MYICIALVILLCTHRLYILGLSLVNNRYIVGQKDGKGYLFCLRAKTFFFKEI